MDSDSINRLTHRAISLGQLARHAERSACANAKSWRGMVAQHAQFASQSRSHSSISILQGRIINGILLPPMKQRYQCPRERKLIPLNGCRIFSTKRITKQIHQSRRKTNQRSHMHWFNVCKRHSESQSIQAFAEILVIKQKNIEPSCNPSNTVIHSSAITRCPRQTCVPQTKF